MLGIIGAMDEEVAQIKEKMTDVTVTSVAGMDFYQGKLGGKDAVVVRSGIGKVNAGMCSQILADRFHISAIVNTGIAGSLRAEINIGDIVVSTDAVQHDMDASGFGYRIGQIPRVDIFASSEICKNENPSICLSRYACVERRVNGNGAFRASDRSSGGISGILV